MLRSYLSLGVALLSALIASVDAAPAATARQSSSLKPRKTGSLTVIENCKNSGQIALTFDDGPYDYESTISNYLTSHGSTGTFFVNGNNYDCIYDEAYVEKLRNTYKQGHLIGSHTWTHTHSTELSDADFNQQLDLVETALKKILGIKPAFFRPPYGEYSDRMVQILAKRGYYTVMWSADTGDANGASVASSKKAYDAVVAKYPAPALVLNHETLETTAKQVVPYAVQKLLSKGYTLVSVAECLGLPKSQWYQSVGTPGKRDATWTCDGTPQPGSG